MPVWTCPRCRKPFEIPEGWETPKSCATCREQVRSSGPPKVPAPPKPIATLSEIQPVPPPLPRRGLLTPARISGLLIVAVGLVAAISYNIRENQAYENAVNRSRELDRAQDELTEKRHQETLERLSAPTKPSGPPACLICKGAKLNDCPICVDGVADCGGCTDGVSTLGGKAERCFICAGKGKIRCDFCNAKGKSPCTFCNGTGVQK